MSKYYSPNTLEHINTDDPADWMGRAHEDAPEYDPQTQGCFYIDGQWIVSDTEPQTEPVPQQITMRQCRIFLHREGMLQDVENLINSLPEPKRTEAQLEWKYASVVQKNNDLIALMIQAAGASESAADNWFIKAAKI